MALIEHTLSHVSLQTRSNVYKCNCMCSYVHLDENCFYIFKETETCYVTPEESNIYRHAKAKYTFEKLCFLVTLHVQGMIRINVSCLIVNLECGLVSKKWLQSAVLSIDRLKLLKWNTLMSIEKFISNNSLITLNKQYVKHFYFGKTYHFTSNRIMLDLISLLTIQG